GDRAPHGCHAWGRNCARAAGRTRRRAAPKLTTKTARRAARSSAAAPVHCWLGTAAASIAAAGAVRRLPARAVAHRRTRQRYAPVRSGRHADGLSHHDCLWSEAMKRSTHHILTTHTGSLPRPTDLVHMVLHKEKKQPVDEDTLAIRVRLAVAEVVRRQAEVGVTILNDGEQGKPGYSTYMKDRLTGCEGESTAAAVSGEAKDFPEYTARRTGRATPNRPACTGPIAWKDRDAVRRDIENLQAAVKEVKAEEVFMTGASPGVAPHFMKDPYYRSEAKY